MADDRGAALEAIAADVRVCTLCELYKGRTRAVPGAGNPHAEILFIGEGPGYNEDKQGLPFVGRSGDYLTELIGSIGLTRDQVFIANVVRCRPPENRDPLPDEIAACRRYMDGQEAIIDPLVIVTLGRYSMARYFPGAKITAIHGRPKHDERRAYVPLFHPAAVLRNPALEQPMAEDFQRILTVLEEVRQRRAGGLPPVPSVPPAPTPEVPPAPTPAAPPVPPAPPARTFEARPAAEPPVAPPDKPARPDDDRPVQLSLF
jgi:DNA polymerase